MRRRIRGDRVRAVARMVVTDERRSRFRDVPDREVAALGGEVEPAAARVDAEHVGAGSGIAERDRATAAEVDARELGVVLARDERALAVWVKPQPVCTAAAG